MPTKLELQKSLGISPGTLAGAIDHLGLPSKEEYTQEEADRILDAVTRPQPAQRPNANNSKGLQVADPSAAQGGITFVQEAMDGAAREGQAIARKRVVTRFTAMVQEENRLMEQGFQHLRSLDSAIDAVEVAWTDTDEEGGMSNFFDQLFPALPGNAPKALPSK